MLSSSVTRSLTPATTDARWHVMNFAHFTAVSLQIRPLDKPVAPIMRSFFCRNRKITRRRCCNYLCTCSFASAASDNDMEKLPYLKSHALNYPLSFLYRAVRTIFWSLLLHASATKYAMFLCITGVVLLR